MIKSDRLLSLDVMRGAVVVGMIVVNSAAFLKGVDGLDVYPSLLHAEWAGFTLADFVFPAFVFLVGVSISIALRNAALTRATLRGIAARSARLFLAGLIVSNLDWAADWSQNSFRVMGVLQRIGLCYFASAILFLTLSARWRVILAFAILLLYWPITLLPMPGVTGAHASDLSVIGANFVSWLDRAIFGPFNFVNGPLGFDPEGLAGTLPAIGQCLLGVAAGERLWKNAQRTPRTHATRDLALAGAALALVGFGWSFFFPFIKALWTSSFVLFSTGLAMILLALCHWLFDLRPWRGVVTTFFAAFGVNAIFAYIVHELASPVLQSDLMRWFAAAGSHALSPRMSSLVPVVVFVLVIWAPLRYLQRRGWIIGI
jgi:predicted acyltransferase